MLMLGYTDTEIVFTNSLGIDIPRIFNWRGGGVVSQLCENNKSVLLMTFHFSHQSINQSKRIYIAPYVAGESEARVGLG